MKVYLYPPVEISQGPTQFLLDGVPTDVSKDSVIPQNTTALPVEDLNVLDAITSFQSLIQNVDTDPGSSAGVPVFAHDASVNQFKYFKVDPTGNLKVSAASLPLPSGAATEAKQDTGNSSLSSIDGKFTVLNAKDFATSAKQDTGNTSLSSINNKLQTNGLLSTANSTSTALGANGVFTGTWEDITNYNAIAVGVHTDQNSASNGLAVEYSYDGISIDHIHYYNIVANEGIGFNLTAEFKYFRIVYTNGASAQSFLKLQSILKTTALFPSQYRLSNALTDQTQAIITRSLIFGKTTGGGGGYVDVKVNPSGALTVEAAVTGSVSVSNFPATQAISAAALPLPSGASTLAEQQTQTTAIGSLTETAPATDIASSGLNGRLQRIAQRLTSLIALLPSSIGTKTSAGSLSVVLASDQAAIGVTPQTSSGTITQTQKSVGLTAVRATVSGSAPGAARKKLMIKPSKNNTGSIYFGASTVTTASGMEIIGPDRLEFTLDASDYYLISDTAAQVVEIVEVV